MQNRRAARVLRHVDTAPIRVARRAPAAKRGFYPIRHGDSSGDTRDAVLVHVEESTGWMHSPDDRAFRRQASRVDTAQRRARFSLRATTNI